MRQHSRTIKVGSSFGGDPIKQAMSGLGGAEPIVAHDWSSSEECSRKLLVRGTSNDFLSKDRANPSGVCGVHQVPADFASVESQKFFSVCSENCSENFFLHFFIMTRKMTLSAVAFPLKDVILLWWFSHFLCVFNQYW